MGRHIACVSTNPARCRDCYRCVRTCPVKAVRVSGGQAEVVAELCISCGNCVRACPQSAKVIRDGLGPVRAALAAGHHLVASVAPSAPAYFDMDSFSQMEQALGNLGFAAAHETSFGAAMVGVAHGELIDREPQRWPVIASSCPVVVNLVEQYFPDLIPHLAPIVSPMIAHGRYLRQRYGAGVFTVFIGPCIAKKREAADDRVAGAIDGVLTFTELAQWMAEAGVAFPSPNPPCVSGDAQAVAIGQSPAPGLPSVASRLFPIEGGLVGTARMDTNMLSSHVVTGSGLGTCQNVLQGIQSGMLEACLVELMACGGGCINGPALEDLGSIAISRQKVMAYTRKRSAHQLPDRAEWPPLERSYSDHSVPVPEYTEEQIRAVMHQVDKYHPEDELNCGSCGYSTCREKAIATLRGMAEATMCLPYMRARAESLTNVVMDATPNAILVVNRELYIQDMSQSAARMFDCNRLASRGRILRDVVPAVDDFLTVRQSGQAILNRIVHMGPDLVVEESIVSVPGKNLMVAILRDVTGREQQRKGLERIRAETLQRTQEVINKQMRVAHEIAGLLGETTAETKVLLTQLARLIDESPSESAEER